MIVDNDLRGRLKRVFETRLHPLRFGGAGAPVATAGMVSLPLGFTDARGQPVGGWLCRPDGAGPFPAVLVVHAHGGRTEIGARELIDGRPAMPDPIGPQLALAGFVAACIDLPCFGSRAGQETESAAAKAALWQGGSLAGRMLGELSSQLDWLAALPEVDAGRIGVLGLSMGATLGTWLAAVDGRVAALAQMICLADMAALIRTGAHDLHGPYMTVPGLLTEGDMGDVAALVAPRPHFVALGQTDPLTPPEAYDPALARLTQAYANAPDRLHLHLSPRTGHVETPAMRHEALAFLARHLVG